MKFWQPGIGQRVRLTDFGMDQVGGLRKNADIEQQQRGFKVTRVKLAYTVPECYHVEVDGRFGTFLLTSVDIEPFPGAPIVLARPEDLRVDQDQALHHILDRDGIAVVGPNGDPHAVVIKRGR